MLRRWDTHLRKSNQVFPSISSFETLTEFMQSLSKLEQAIYLYAFQVQNTCNIPSMALTKVKYMFCLWTLQPAFATDTSPWYIIFYFLLLTVLQHVS